MHPGQYSDYFLAGSQDNNSIQFDSYEIDRTRAVLGGDGMYCHIDQNDPQYQLASSQFGNYALSNDGQPPVVGNIIVGILANHRVKL